MNDVELEALLAARLANDSGVRYDLRDVAAMFGIDLAELAAAGDE